LIAGTLYIISNIRSGELCEVTSHYLYFRKCQDMKTISKPDWEQETGFLRFISTQDIFTLSLIFQGENYARFLPSIIKFDNLKIVAANLDFSGLI
jgi:hypothetical protein